MIVSINNLIRNLGGVIHRKIKANLIQGDFIASINKCDSAKHKKSNVYIVVPRLPFLVRHGGNYGRSHVQLFLQQLPENTQIRLRFGNTALRLYLNALACLYCRFLFGVLSLFTKYRFNISDDGDFIIVTNTALISVNTESQLATHFYLLDDLIFYDNDIQMRSREHVGMVDIKNIFQRGYVEDFIMPDQNIYNYAADIGEQAFFKSAIKRMTSFYCEMPGKDMFINKYVNGLIQAIEESPFRSWIITPDVVKLMSFCTNMIDKKTIRLCTIHGDLKVDQFVYTENCLFLMDWEFSRLSLPENDFANLMICFDNIHDLVNQPEIFEERYKKSYHEMKNTIHCTNILSVQEMIGIYLLDSIGNFSRILQTMTSANDFDGRYRYVLLAVSKFVNVCVKS